MFLFLLPSNSFLLQHDTSKWKLSDNLCTIPRLQQHSKYRDILRYRISIWQKGWTISLYLFVKTTFSNKNMVMCSLCSVNLFSLLSKEPSFCQYLYTIGEQQSTLSCTKQQPPSDVIQQNKSCSHDVTLESLLRSIPCWCSSKEQVEGCRVVQRTWH